MKTIITKENNSFCNFLFDKVSAAFFVKYPHCQWSGIKVQGGEKGIHQGVLDVLVGFDTKDQGYEISCESITINH